MILTHLVWSTKKHGAEHAISIAIFYLLIVETSFLYFHILLLCLSIFIEKASTATEDLLSRIILFSFCGFSDD